MTLSEEDESPPARHPIRFPPIYRRLAPASDQRRGWLLDVDWEPVLDLHDYQYLINPRDKCKGAGNMTGDSGLNITMLILVFSATGNKDRRDVIRRTWIRCAMEHNVPTKTLFLLGAPKDPRQQDDLFAEAETYGDILQEDFVDSYYNLSIKTIMAFKWAAEFCSNSAFFMKVDDDVVVNVLSLTKDLSSAPPHYLSNFVAGMRISNSKPMRDSRSKWYTPRNVFFDRIYPPYPQGHGYVLSIDMAEKLYLLSRKTELFPWEDVYLGILLEKLGVKPVQRSAFRFTHCVTYRGSLIRTNTTLLALTRGYLTWDLSPLDMVEAWNAIENNRWTELSGKDVCTEEFIQTARYFP